MAATRPDICAEPMLRAPRPEMVSESTLTGALLCGLAGCGVCASAEEPAESMRARSGDESMRERNVFIRGNPSPKSVYRDRSRLAGGLLASPVPAGGFAPSGFGVSAFLGETFEASGAPSGAAFAAGWRKRASSIETLGSIFV